jgi:hypothetical protein
MYASRSLLQFFCFITFIVYCVAVRLPNYSTDLGITLNEITKTDGPIAECIVYTSLVEYEDDVSKFTDAHIGGLARQGESPHLGRVRRAENAGYRIGLCAMACSGPFGRASPKTLLPVV